ncbi:MAG: sugar ABC transporter substrate-binding protein [bacterium]|nr:sugar ABC transporter substrate-binding protein [bacterium]
MLRRILSSLILAGLLMASLSLVVAQEDSMTDFTFTGWSLNEGATRDVIMQAVVEFADANGVTVTDVAYPFNEYFNQIILQASAGNLSGLVQMDVAWMAPLAALGVLEDLTPYIEEDVYSEAALASCQVGGVQYGFPWTTASIGMVANMELLEAAGITELPATIAEFEAALEALKAYNPDIIPYAGMTDTAQLKDVIPWIWAFGGDVFNEDGTIALNGEGAVMAVEWYASLLERGLIAADVDRFDARQLFAQGSVGFYEDAIVARALAASNKPAELELTVVPVPRPVLAEGDAPQALFWGHCLVVVADDSAQTAIAFAQYLTTDTVPTTRYFEQLSLPPTSVEFLESELFTSNDYVSGWTSQITATARPNPFWAYVESARMEGILGEAVQQVLGGNMSAQDALDGASEDIADLLD